MQVLGPGCARCREAEDNVRLAAEAAGLDLVVEKVTDFKEILRLGVLATPALVLDGRILCTGRVPGVQEVAGWLTQAARAEA